MGTCDINSRNSFQLYCVYEIGNEEQKRFINEVQRFIERQNIRKYDYHICEYNEFRIKITFKDNRHLREEVIYDGVPCYGLPDSIIMSTLVDKTLIVSAENKTTNALLNNRIKSLEGVNANIAGDILNQIDMNANKIYGKYYSYYGDNN